MVAIYRQCHINYIRNNLIIFVQKVFESLFLEFTLNDSKNVVSEIFRVSNTNEEVYFRPNTSTRANLPFASTHEATIHVYSCSIHSRALVKHCDSHILVTRPFASTREAAHRTY